MSVGRGNVASASRRRMARRPNANRPNAIAAGARRDSRNADGAREEAVQDQLHPFLERPAPPDVIELLELRLDRDAVLLEIHMDALRAQEGALTRRLAEPAEGTPAFLAFGRVPAPLPARPVEKKSGSDREKNRPEQRNAEIQREGISLHPREAEAVPEAVASVMSQEAPGAAVALHALDFFACGAPREADRHDFHEGRRLLKGLDRPRVEGSCLLERQGGFRRPKCLRVQQGEVVPRRDAACVAFQRFLVVLLRRAEIAVHEPDVPAIDEAPDVARSHAGPLGVLGDRAVVLAERLVQAPENEADVHVVGKDVLGRLEVVEDALVVAGLVQRLGGPQDR